ncbi:MAG: S8 family serine peptidase [SAR324 cluster bacterium]|nr:S8 family serine peptidase [SAR324 cluster bacterium]
MDQFLTFIKKCDDGKFDLADWSNKKIRFRSLLFLALFFSFIFSDCTLFAQGKDRALRVSQLTITQKPTLTWHSFGSLYSVDISFDNFSTLFYSTYDHGGEEIKDPHYEMPSALWSYLKRKDQLYLRVRALSRTGQTVETSTAIQVNVVLPSLTRSRRTAPAVPQLLKRENDASTGIVDDFFEGFSETEKIDRLELDDRFVQQEILIQLQDGVTEFPDDVYSVGFPIEKVVTDLNQTIRRLQIAPDITPEEAADFLESIPEILAVQPNFTFKTELVSSDPQLNSTQWAPQKIMAPVAWENNITGNGVTIAVLDTGIRSTHNEFAGSGKLLLGPDFGDKDNDPTDIDGHGTHVAGVLAANSNGIGMVGIAPDASILAIKVFSNSGLASDLNVIKGIHYAVANGAQVLNLSLGSANIFANLPKQESLNALVVNAIKDAIEAGVVVVASAGNDSTTLIGYPGSSSGAIMVGALRADDTLAPFSNHNTALSVMAPGYEIYAPDHQADDRYRFLSGTSMAAPMTAGAVALILQKNPALTPSEVKTLLENTADDLGPSGYDGFYGAGRINIAKALGLNEGAETTPARIESLEAATTQLKIRFSKNMLADKTTNAVDNSSNWSGDAPALNNFISSASYHYDSTTQTLTITNTASPLSSGSKVTLLLKTGVADATGIAIAGNFQQPFTSASVPTHHSISGKVDISVNSDYKNYAHALAGDDGKLTVLFNHPVTKTSAESASNYKLRVNPAYQGNSKNNFLNGSLQGGTAIDLAEKNFAYNETSRTLVISGLAISAGQTFGLALGNGIRNAALNNPISESLNKIYGVVYQSSSTAPSLLASASKYDASNHSGEVIEVSFSRDMNASDVMNIANYSLSVNEISRDLSRMSILYDSGFKKAYLLGIDLYSNHGQNYNVSVNNIKTTDGTLLTSPLNSISGTVVSANVPPDISHVIAFPQAIQIFFKYHRKIDANTAETISNYALQTPIGTDFSLNGYKALYDLKTNSVILNKSDQSAFLNAGSSLQITLSNIVAEYGGTDPLSSTVVEGVVGSQDFSFVCKSSGSGSLLAISTFSNQKNCNIPSSHYVVQNGHTVTWNGSGGPITGSITVENGGSLKIIGDGAISGSVNLSGAHLILGANLTVTGSLATDLSTVFDLTENVSLSSANALKIGTLHLGDKALTLGSNSTDLQVAFPLLIDHPDEKVITGGADFTIASTIAMSGGQITSTAGTVQFTMGGTISAGALDLQESHLIFGGIFNTTGAALNINSSSHVTLSGDAEWINGTSINIGSLDLNDYALTLASSGIELIIHDPFILDQASEKLITGSADLTLLASLTMSDGQITSNGGTLTMASSILVSQGLISADTSNAFSLGSTILFSSSDPIQFQTGASLALYNTALTTAKSDTPASLTITGSPNLSMTGGKISNILVDGGNLNTYLTDDQGNNTNISFSKSGINVADPSNKIREDGTSANVSVVLTTRPRSIVSIGFSSSDETEGTVSPSTLNFTPENWFIPQTITVRGVDDQLVDGNITFALVTDPSASPDPTFNQLNPRDVAVTNIDNDGMGFEVSGQNQFISEEGSSSTLTVRLNTQPAKDVHLNLTSLAGSEGTVFPSYLNFTSSNWNGLQRIEVTGVNDNIQDGDQSFQIALASTSEDVNYHNLNSFVNASNIDDDSAGFIVSSVNGSTSENGETAAFSVRLSKRPVADVLIKMFSSNPSEGNLATASLIFSIDNWNAAQRVLVTGADDPLQDGPQVYSIVMEPAISLDQDYNGLKPVDVSVINTDDETAGFVLSPLVGFSSEEGETAALTLRLNRQPITNVTVSTVIEDSTEAIATPSSLNFTPLNWNQNQTISIAGVDDSEKDGDQPFTLVLSANSSDSGFNKLMSQVNSVNFDNESPAFLVTPPSIASSEDGSAAEFTVRLSKRPSADVSFSIGSSGAELGFISVDSLTFSSSNWNIPQTVTVKGADDFLMDGDQAFSILFGTASSKDPNYHGRKAPKVKGIIHDDDLAGFAIAGIGETTEGGGTAAFSVKLKSQPTADVALGLHSSDLSEAKISISSLTFTRKNWNIAQTVNVTGINDNDVDGDQTFQIILSSVSSADAHYQGIDPPDVSMVNIDDDGDPISSNNDGTLSPGSSPDSSIPGGNPGNDSGNIALGGSSSVESTTTTSSTTTSTSETSSVSATITSISTAVTSTSSTSIVSTTIPGNGNGAPAAINDNTVSFFGSSTSVPKAGSIKTQEDGSVITQFHANSNGGKQTSTTSILQTNGSVLNSITFADARGVAITTQILAPAGVVSKITSTGSVEMSLPPVISLQGTLTSIKSSIAANGASSNTTTVETASGKVLTTKTNMPTDSKTSISELGELTTTFTPSASANPIQEAAITVGADGAVVTSTQLKNAAGTMIANEIKAPAGSIANVNSNGETQTETPPFQTSSGSTITTQTSTSADGVIQATIRVTPPGSAEPKVISLPDAEPGTSVEIMQNENGSGKVVLLTPLTQALRSFRTVSSVGSNSGNYFVGRTITDKLKVYIIPISEATSLKIEKAFDAAHTTVRLQSGGAEIRIGDSLRVIGEGEIFLVSNEAASVSLKAGINFIAFPVKTTVNPINFSSTFAGMHSVWQWNAGKQNWSVYTPDSDLDSTFRSVYGLTDITSPIESGTGLWIYTRNAGSLRVGDKGDYDVLPDLALLTPGWSFMGTETEISIEAIMNANPLIDSVWHWDGSHWRAFAADETLADLYQAAHDVEHLSLKSTIPANSAFWLFQSESGISSQVEFPPGN